MKKKTFIRKVILKPALEKKKDFGLGVGVVYQDEIVFTDDRGRGFGSPLFAASMIRQNEELVESLVEVKFEEKK